MPPAVLEPTEPTSARARCRPLPPRLRKSALAAQEVASLRAPKSPSNAHRSLQHRPVPPRPRVTGTVTATLPMPRSLPDWRNQV